MVDFVIVEYATLRSAKGKEKENRKNIHWFVALRVEMKRFSKNDFAKDVC